jgi:hypothetical protein
MAHCNRLTGNINKEALFVNLTELRKSKIFLIVTKSENPMLDDLVRAGVNSMLDEEEDDADSDGLSGLEWGLLIVSLLLLMGGVLAMAVSTGNSFVEIPQMIYLLLALVVTFGIWFGVRYLFITFFRKTRNVVVEDLNK